MNRSRLAAAILLSTLMLVTPVEAKSVGLKSGDTMEYSYSILTTYATPDGPNVSSIFTAHLQISIFSVDLNDSGGSVGYSESVTNFNGTEETSTTSASNFTTIFDPYDNKTYFGVIGFWPFTYTDLKTGTIKNMEVFGTYGNSSFSYSAAQYINASISRRNGLISINMTLLPFLRQGAANATLPHTYFAMNYNSTTGALQNYAEYSNVYSIVEKIFSYRLLSYHAATHLDLTFVPYVIGGAVVILAAIAVLRRASPDQKKEKKMREKFA